MATIRQASETEDLPIMTCANKIDVRGEKEELGFKVLSRFIRWDISKHIHCSAHNIVHSTVQLGEIK